jgi:hypothetical protein
LSLTASAADMIATSVEVACSPATYQIKLRRSMSLRAIVNPDPSHARSGQKSVWPKVSDHFVITVQFEGGTAFRKTGPMPAREDDAIDVLFSTATADALPSAPGQRFQIIVGIYSKSNWLCGHKATGWINAIPTDGDGRTENISIVEQLVPLIAGTQYQHLEKLDYDGASGHYAWSRSRPAPIATATGLDRQDVRSLVGITINNLAYQLGYAYYAQN